MWGFLLSLSLKVTFYRQNVDLHLRIKRHVIHARILRLCVLEPKDHVNVFVHIFLSFIRIMTTILLSIIHVFKGRRSDAENSIIATGIFFND